MTKAEFRKIFTTSREKKLHELYKDGSRACLAMSLADIPKQVDRLWRKHRGTLRDVTVAEYRKMVLKENSDDTESNTKV